MLSNHSQLVLHDVFIEQPLRRELFVALAALLQNGVMFVGDMSVQIGGIYELRVAHIAIVQIVHNFVVLIGAMQSQSPHRIEAHVTVLALVDRIEDTFVVLQVLQQAASAQERWKYVGCECSGSL